MIALSISSLFLGSSSVPVCGAFGEFRLGLITSGEFIFFVYFSIPLIVRATQFINIYGEVIPTETESVRLAQVNPASYSSNSFALVVVSAMLCMVPLLAFIMESDLNPFVYLNMCSMLIHGSLQILAIIKAYQSVNHVRYNINVLKELVLTVCVWIVCSGMYHFFMILSYEYAPKTSCRISEENWGKGIMVLILRNFLLLAVIVYTCFWNKPAEIMQRLSSYVDDINRDCLVKVETALVTEQALAKFVDYMNKEGNVLGIRQINAYTVIKEYEEFASVDNDPEPEKLHEKAVEIWERFHDPEADTYLDNTIPFDVERSIEQSLKDKDEDLDKHLFDQLYGVIINSLQNYYTGFKSSLEFKKLARELDKKSLISNKLKRADLV